MTDLPLILVLMAIVLLYASWLLAIRLGSQGVARGRILRTLVALWGAFLCLFASMGLLRAVVGPIPRSTLAGELVAQLAAARHLAWWLQGVILALFVLAVALWVRVLLTLQRLPHPSSGIPSSLEEDHE